MSDEKWTGQLLDTWGRRNRKHADRKCPQCGTVFRPKDSESRYCSRPCSWANNGKWQVPKPEVWWMTPRGYIEGRVVVDGVRRQVRQHRHVMEQALGRALEPHEDVHHINGVKSDNRLDNLEVISHSAHSSRHGKGRQGNTRGKALRLSDAERARRSEHMRRLHQEGRIVPPQFRKALAAARGEQA